MIVPQLNIGQFNELFPFYILLDEDLKVTQCGKSMIKLLPEMKGRCIHDFLEITRPKNITINFSTLKNYKELVIFRGISDRTILFRCQVENLADEKILLVGTPWFSSMNQVVEHNLNMNDFAISDSLIDLLHVLKTEEIANNDVVELLEKINKQKNDAEKMTIRLNSLFQYATEGIILTNSNGTIIMINPSACNMFNYTAEELIGKAIEILIPDQVKKQHTSHRQGFYANPHNRKMGNGLNLKGQQKNGNTFPVEVSLSTYLQNEERFIIAFIVDITQRKLSEDSMLHQQLELEKISNEMRRLNTELEAKVEERTMILKEALQKLEDSQEELSTALDKERQLNEIKGRFIAMASHEFRTPLSTILSSATLMTKYTSTDEQLKRDRHINKIKDSVKHLDSILNDFLSLGKLDEGKINTKKEELNIVEVVNDTIYEMNGNIKKDQHLLYEHTGPEIVISDKMLIINILINLFSNAIKFSDEGKDIFIQSENKNNELIISVRDEGMGIPEEDKNHLFSSFFRAKNAFNIQGTGLGLHIVNRYMELLKGTIDIESTLGKGTKITFNIPIKP